jgi:hypothetical protein
MASSSYLVDSIRHRRVVGTVPGQWGTDTVSRSVIRDLIETKTPKVLKDLPNQGEGWRVRYAFFARAGFTAAARAEAESAQTHLVDLEKLDADLASV